MGASRTGLLAAALLAACSGDAGLIVSASAGPGSLACGPHVAMRTLDVMPSPGDSFFTVDAVAVGSGAVLTWETAHDLTSARTTHLGFMTDVAGAHVSEAAAFVDAVTLVPTRLGPLVVRTVLTPGMLVLDAAAIDATGTRTPIPYPAFALPAGVSGIVYGHCLGEDAGVVWLTHDGSAYDSIAVLRWDDTGAPHLSDVVSVDGFGGVDGCASDATGTYVLVGLATEPERLAVQRFDGDRADGLPVLFDPAGIDAGAVGVDDRGVLVFEGSAYARGTLGLESAPEFSFSALASRPPAGSSVIESSPIGTLVGFFPMSTARMDDGDVVALLYYQRPTALGAVELHDGSLGAPVLVAAADCATRSDGLVSGGVARWPITCPNAYDDSELRMLELCGPAP